MLSDHLPRNDDTINDTILRKSKLVTPTVSLRTKGRHPTPECNLVKKIGDAKMQCCNSSSVVFWRISAQFLTAVGLSDDR